MSYDSPGLVIVKRSRANRFRFCGDELLAVIDDRPCREGDGGYVPVAEAAAAPSASTLASALLAADPAALHAICFDSAGRYLGSASHRCRELTDGSVRRIWQHTHPKTTKAVLIHRDAFTAAIQTAAADAQPGITITYSGG